MARRRRSVGFRLLPALLAVGIVFVGVGGLVGHPVIFAGGLLLVALSLIMLLLLSRSPRAR